MIQLPPFETFAFVTYFILNAFLAKELLGIKQASKLHKLAYGSLALGFMIIVRFLI